MGLRDQGPGTPGCDRIHLALCPGPNGEETKRNVLWDLPADPAGETLSMLEAAEALRRQLRKQQRSWRFPELRRSRWVAVAQREAHVAILAGPRGVLTQQVPATWCPEATLHRALTCSTGPSNFIVTRSRSQAPPISQFHTLQFLRLVHTTRGGKTHTKKTHHETSRKERVGMEPPPVTFLSLSALTRDSLPVSSQSQSTSKLSRAFKKSPESCANTSLRQEGTIWCLRKKLSQQEELENKI